MKSFKLVLVLAVLALNSSAQTVGDHLNYVKQQRPGGEFKKSNDNERYFYNWEDDRSIWVYVMDLNLRCEGIMIYPKNSVNRNTLISVFENDPDWVKIDERTWRYYRDDGSILQTILDYVPDVGPTFVIKELK